MSNNGTVSGLAAVVSALEAEAEALQGQLDAERESVRVKDAELRKVRKAIEALVGPVEKPVSKRQGKRFGQERLLLMIEQIRALPDSADPEIPGSFTSPWLQAKLGVHKHQVDPMVSILRDQGLIRMVGQHRQGGKGKVARLYVLNDEQ